jgi:hypothetical protein
MNRPMTTVIRLLSAGALSATLMVTVADELRGSEDTRSEEVASQYNAVPARTAAVVPDISTTPIVVPTAYMDTGHSMAAPLSVPESPGHAGRCRQDNVSELPFMAPRESGQVVAELVPLDCPRCVSMSQLNPGMYEDLVEEVCGDYEGPCIVGAVCKLTRQVKVTWNFLIVNVTETKCHYGGCQSMFDDPITAAEASFMSVDGT